MRAKSFLIVSLFLSIVSPQFVFAKETAPVVCALNQSWNGSECICANGYAWNDSQTVCEKKATGKNAALQTDSTSSTTDSSEPKKVAATPQGVFNSGAQKEWNAFVTALTNVFNWFGDKFNAMKNFFVGLNASLMK